MELIKSEVSRKMSSISNKWLGQTPKGFFMDNFYTPLYYQVVQQQMKDIWNRIYKVVEDWVDISYSYELRNVFEGYMVVDWGGI